MMYEYMTLGDDTTIAHSEMKMDGTVKVYMEKPVYGGFHHATCLLPKYEWRDIEGYTDEDIEFLNEYVHNNAHLMIEFSKCGGFEYASGF